VAGFGYVVCLGVTILGALTFPLAWFMLRARTEGRVFWSSVAGISFVLGICCSLPFSTTQFRWLPLAAGAYFAGIFACVVLYSLSLLLHRSEGQDGS